MDGMKYVKTQFGSIPIEDLPLVQSEPIHSKLSTLIIFSITVVIIIMILNLLLPKGKRCFAADIPAPKFQASVAAARIDICIPLTSILDKVVFIIKSQNGPALVEFRRSEMTLLKVRNPRFMMYSINFTAEIMQIILVSVPGRYVTYADIAIFNDRGTKVWKFSSEINIAKENYITITQLDLFQDRGITTSGDFGTATALSIRPDGEVVADPTVKVIANNEDMALYMTKDGEKYGSY
jgi:hypothetical protein